MVLLNRCCSIVIARHSISYHSAGSASEARFYSNPDQAVSDGVWMCPFCYSVLQDEHSFDEHLKKLLQKLSHDGPYQPVVRRSIQNKRAKCVFDVRDAQHISFIRPWKSADNGAHDKECCRSFIYHMRQLLTPGARAVFTCGTGHVVDVQKYIEQCVDGHMPEIKM